MARRVARLDLDTLADLPGHVRSCLRWEVDPQARRGLSADEARAEKESWLSSVLLEWGSCGRVLYVDDDPAGFVLYAPGRYLAGARDLPTVPVSDDAVHLATAQVFPRYAGGGIGRVLMQVMVKDLVRRGGYRAVEAIGAAGHHGQADCVLPAEFLRRVGFKTAEPHPAYPRLRLDLRSVVSWRTEVEQALERLLGAVRPSRAPAPAPVPVAPAQAHRVTGPRPGPPGRAGSRGLRASRPSGP